MKTRITTVISDVDWDNAVIDAYGKPYSFQQQDDCKPHGTFKFTVPDYATDFKNDSVPEEVNHPEMGVSFAAWLERDPETPIKNEQYAWQTHMWWERNFYPDIHMIANDLHAKGLLDAGDYTIDIDW